MARAEVKMIGRETIKPSSPTPSHLKTYNFSFFDQIQYLSEYASELLYYTCVDHDQHRCVRHLKSSLSQTLTHFYPLARRLTDNNLFIDCTDEGVEFTEVKVNASLSDILRRPDPMFLSELVPFNSTSVRDSPALLVQANLFECGGVAIGVSLCHKIADSCSLNLFVKGWAAISRADPHYVAPDMSAISCRFPTSNHYPVSNRSLSRDSSIVLLPGKTRRYVFDGDSINTLRAKARSDSVQRPSRVEVVAGFIWLCTMKLKLRSEKTRSHGLFQPMHLGNKLNPPMPENCFGNLVWGFATLLKESDEKVLELKDLVSEIRRALRKEIERVSYDAFFYIREKTPDLYERQDLEKFLVTSFCKFGYYEETDFGWGKPVWVSGHELFLKNFGSLFDTKDGEGVEVWLKLDDDHDIDLLQTDQDFLEFASVNPSVDLH